MINEKDIIIYNATIVSGDDCTFHSNSALVLEDGYIKNIIYKKLEWENLINNSKVKAYDFRDNILRPGFIDMHIQRSILFLANGSSHELFERLSYEKMKRPVYPLDGDFEAKLEYIK